MRILDVDSDKATSEILLMLTFDEASKMKDGLERLLSQTVHWDHDHINDLENKHEVTIAIYNDILDSNFYYKQYDQRTQKLILEDK